MSRYEGELILLTCVPLSRRPEFQSQLPPDRSRIALQRREADISSTPRMIACFFVQSFDTSSCVSQALSRAWRRRAPTLKSV